jgi:LysR family glycine cleavage system transcriptional activator
MNTGNGRLSLDLLRGFEAAARHLSFTDAAQELFLTQSAVSRQVKSLEEQLGRKLFVRAHRRLALTEAGLSLQQAVTQAQALIGGAVDALRPLPRASSLTLAVADPFATLVVAPALASLPVVQSLRELRLINAVDGDDQQRVRADVIIRHFKDGAAPSGALPLAREQVVPLCAPVLARRLAAQDPEALRGEVLLRYEASIARRMRVDWYRWLQAHALGALRPRAWMQFNRYDQVVTAAVGGAGVMLGRLPLAQALVRTGLLATPWPQRAVPTGGWHAVVDPGSPSRAVAEVMVRQLREHLAAL